MRIAIFHLGRASSRRAGESGRSATAILVIALMSAACASQVPPSHEPLELGQAGLPSLAGNWVGTRETVQAGKCSIGERADKRWQRAQVGDETRLKIAVEADGTITARRYVEDGTLAKDQAWWGSVSDALEVVADEDSKAECQGVKSNVVTRLRGRFDRSATGPALELAGLEKTCPKMGCEFNIVYRLTRQ